MTGWAPLTDKDFKEVPGQNRHVGSLDGVTTVEKEKFPKNFWPDVSMHERTSMYAGFCACLCVCVCVDQREMSGQMSLLGLLWVSACSDREMRQIMCINQ